VAQERLQIRLDAIDNTKKAFSSLKGSIFNLKTAFASLGIGLFAKQVVDTGKSVEKLGLRFKFLFGSAQEGSKAFDTLVGFASRVPFSLEEISGASGNLAVVAKDADELAKILEITGNVASVTGLDFQQTAEQIQRSFSGGIASADVFRERGVRALLGFEAGATISAEQTAKKFEEVFGKGGRFGNATAELATTFEGVLSMIGDKIFKFKKDISDAQFFEAFKTQFRLLDQFLEENSQQIEQFAISIGRFLADAVRALGQAVLFLKENMDFIIDAFKLLIGLAVAKTVVRIAQAFYTLVPAIKAASIATIAFNQAVRKNLIIAGIAIAVANIDKVIKKLREYAKILGLVTDDQKDLNEEFDDFATGGTFTTAISKANEELTIMEQILKTIGDAWDKVFGQSTKDAITDLGKATEKAFEGVKKGIGDATAQAIIFGKSFSETLKGALRQALANFISQLVQTGIQILINTQLAKAMKEVLSGGSGGGGNILGSIFSIGKSILGFAEGGSVKGGVPITVGERGREMFIPSTDGQIVPNHELGMGATVNFTIVANDTKDFDRLLVERRSTITNIINQALNQRGKPALV
jgi:hypothetical protein